MFKWGLHFHYNDIFGGWHGQIHQTNFSGAEFAIKNSYQGNSLGEFLKWVRNFFEFWYHEIYTRKSSLGRKIYTVKSNLGEQNM